MKNDGIIACLLPFERKGKLTCPVKLNQNPGAGGTRTHEFFVKKQLYNSDVSYVCTIFWLI
jgi:hypothetical protein